MAAHEPANVAQSLDGLKPKEDKAPSSAGVLHTWIAKPCGQYAAKAADELVEQGQLRELLPV
jgi:hypothetical protein